MSIRKIMYIVLAGLSFSVCSVVKAEQDLKLWYEQPAKEWVEALPIGNGGFGAMVFGGPAKGRIQFNDDTLFTGEPHDYSHKGAAKYLPELRRLLLEGKQNEAHELGNKEFMSISTKGNNRQEAYQPFGDLNLVFAGHDKFTVYYRDLDLNNAIATVRYKVDDVTYTREVFASFPDKAIVMQISADKPGKLNFLAGMTCLHKDSVVKSQGDDLLILSGQVENGKTRFEGRLLVRVDGGETVSSDAGIEIKGANKAVLILVGASSFANYKDISANPTKRCLDKLNAIGEKSYTILRQRHIADYQELFNRCGLDLGITDKAKLPTDKRLKQFGPEDPQLATLFFQYGRYLLISCSRPGSQPANLQGLWNDKKNPPWDSKYTCNINTEMNYWPAELTGLSECHLPLFEALKDLSVAGAIVAKEHYGARGWVVHHNFDLWRGAAPINNANHGIWVSGGAWMCQHLWWNYAFTGDKEFLRNDAYPLMKGASLFFMDYLVEDQKGKEKYLISGPSNSPERGGLVMGPTMDHQIIRTLFVNTAHAARELGVDEDLQKELLVKAGRIAPNQIGSLGQLKEWFYTEDPKTTHRHVSHLWGLHPGLEIHPRTTPELAEACRVTLKLRGDGGTGWSKAWKINFWARLLDGDHSYKMLAEALRGNTYPNLFDSCPPFQIDGNFGATSGIAEMLLQSNGSEIEILPALPSAFPSGKISGLRARGGFVVDIQWQNGELVSVAIQSLGGTEPIVRYKDKVCKLRIKNTQTVILNKKAFELE
ncbi:MAG: glycoside hydrolase family 95 protein [Phycisphaerae bacterium]|nr:glycoside hydrolase family 95 protein [Phycisphaerae bacterium]